MMIAGIVGGGVARGEAVAGPRHLDPQVERAIAGAIGGQHQPQ